MFSDAEAYDRAMGRHSRLLAPLFIRFIGSIHDGDHVLDVGCGTGSLTFTIASTTKASKIVGIDRSEGFIEYARSTNADPRVTFEVGDAQQLPYPEASFDKSLSLLVIHVVPDPPQAVAEMRRVTRPGGMVTVCSWASTDGLEIGTIFRKAATAVDPSAEVQRVSNFRTKEGTIRALLVESGLREVEETALTIQMNFDSFDDLWSDRLRGGGPHASYIAKLSPEHKQALRDKLRQEVLKGRPDGPFTFQARALAARGKVADD
jgi:ubiquinone/menaquinone biosynthesis C-methylase UbiE